MRKSPRIFIETFCNLSWGEKVHINIKKLILTHLEQVLTFNSTLCHQMLHEAIPAGIYLLNVNNRNTRTRCEICSKLTIKIPERRHYCWLWTCNCRLGIEHWKRNFPASIKLFKANKGITRTICKNCSKLTKKTRKRRHWRCSGVFIIPLNIFQSLFWCFHYWVWINKCRLGWVNFYTYIYSAN